MFLLRYKRDMCIYIIGSYDQCVEYRNGAGDENPDNWEILLGQMGQPWDSWVVYNN